MTIDDSDWKDLERAWQATGQDNPLTEALLRGSLRRHRVLIAIQSTVEIVSFGVAMLVALWINRHSPGLHPTLLFGWLVLQAAIVLWIRYRESLSQTTSVMEGIDASIERDERLVRSIRLASVLGMLALAAVLIASAQAVFNGNTAWSPALLSGLLLLVIYVFSVQIIIVRWARRVRLRRKRLEDIRRALKG